MLSQQNRFKEENLFFHKFFYKETKITYWSGEWLTPLKNKKISSPYGRPRIYDNGIIKIHRGTDYAARSGTAVRAPNSGMVVWAGNKYVRGNVIVLDHGNGLYTTYFHLKKILVKTGSYVHKGKIIGTVGQSGLASGPHLHWGVRARGNPVDGTFLYQSIMNSFKF